MQVNLVSIVIPVYKKEKTIKKELENTYNQLKNTPYKFEFIVVVDGTSLDKSFENAKKAKVPKLKVYGYKNNKGKGQAVRFGFYKATGDVVGFIDSGGDINPQGVVMLLEHLKWYNADVIIGSKLHSASVVNNYSFFRKCLTFGYYMFVKFLFHMNIRDTQTGLKFFKKEVLNVVLPLMVIKKWAFDMELLAVANKYGFKIYDAPVNVDFGLAKSAIISKSLVKSVYDFTHDTIAVWYRMNILKYYDKGVKRQKKYDADLKMYVNTGRIYSNGSLMNNLLEKLFN